MLQAYLPDALGAHACACRTGRPPAAPRGGAADQGARRQGREPRRWSTSTPSLHDWPLATWRTKQDSRHQLQARPRLRAARPSGSRNVRHRRRRPQPLRRRLRLAAGRASAASTTGVEFEMLLGMAHRPGRGRHDATSATCCSTRPVVHPGEFDVAIAYLIRRLEESASQDNFMSARLRARRERGALRAREASRFLASLAELDDDGPGPEPRAEPRACRPRRCRTTRLREHAGHRPVARRRTATGAARILGRVADVARSASTPIAAAAIDDAADARTRRSTPPSHDGRGLGRAAPAPSAPRSCTAPASCSSRAAPT